MFTLGRPESSLDPVKAIVGKNTASHLLSDHVNAGWAYIVRNMIDALGPHYKEISDSKVPQDAPTEILLAAGVATTRLLMNRQLIKRHRKQGSVCRVTNKNPPTPAMS